MRDNYAVKNKEKFTLQWPVDSHKPEVTKEVDAKELWDKIIDSAWTTAEPGIFFWDHLIKNSIPDLYATTNSLMKTTSSNPCGEIPLGQDSCRLLVINLTSFVSKPFTKKAK